MKIIEGGNKTGKSMKILAEYNNEKSILIMPELTVNIYTKDKDMKCKFVRSRSFLEIYSNYHEQYFNNAWGVQRRERLKTPVEYLRDMLERYAYLYKDEYEFIVVDLDIPKGYFEKPFKHDNLVVTLINNQLDRIMEYEI